MKVVQCWDDGVTTDRRLIDILRRHNAKATFNLNAGLMQEKRSGDWLFKGNLIQRLGWNEAKELYDGFTIANHSLSHARLEQLASDELSREILDGRKILEDFFDAPIDGFVYPYGSYNEIVMDIVRTAGHTYARTVNYEFAFPPENPFEFHPTCKLNAEDFMMRYEQSKAYGLFYFWGHSYELTDEAMWQEFEEKIARISADEETVWADLDTLF